MKTGATLELSVTANPASPTPVVVGKPLSLTLTLTKKNLTGVAFTTFQGTAEVSSDLEPTFSVKADLTSLSKTLSGLSLTTPGNHTLTVTVKDSDPLTPNLTATKTVTVDVADLDVAVYGDSAAYLVTELSAIPAMAEHKFTFVANLASLSNYSALIVNKAGSGWTGATDLTLTEANQIKTFFASGKPVFVAADSLPNVVFQVLSDALLGVGNSQTRVTLKGPDGTPIAGPLSLTASGPGSGAVASVTLFGESYCNGFSPTAGTPIVSTTFEGSPLSLIAASPSGTKALLSGESLYHAYGGENSTETQWWESNPELIKALLEWLIPSL